MTAKFGSLFTPGNPDNTYIAFGSRDWHETIWLLRSLREKYGLKESVVLLRTKLGVEEKIVKPYFSFDSATGSKAYPPGLRSAIAEIFIETSQFQTYDEVIQYAEALSDRLLSYHPQPKIPAGNDPITSLAAQIKGKGFLEDLIRNALNGGSLVKTPDPRNQLIRLEVLSYTIDHNPAPIQNILTYGGERGYSISEMNRAVRKLDEIGVLTLEKKTGTVSIEPEYFQVKVE